MVLALLPCRLQQLYNKARALERSSQRYIHSRTRLSLALKTFVSFQTQPMQSPVHTVHWYAARLLLCTCCVAATCIVWQCRFMFQLT